MMLKLFYKQESIFKCFLMFVIFNVTSTIYAMEVVTFKKEAHALKETLKINVLDDLPKECVRLLKLLFEKPCFDIDVLRKQKYQDQQVSIFATGVKNIRMLPLETSVDSLIIQSLIEIANKYLWLNPLLIKSFGTANNIRWVSKRNSQNLGYGIEIWNQAENCSYVLSELKAACETAVNEIKSGWCPTSLEKFWGIRNQKSETEWYLFIKRDVFVDAVNCLLSKFNLREKMDCGSCGRFVCTSEQAYQSAPPKWKPTHSMYLWVKKDALEEVNRVLGFGLMP